MATALPASAGPQSSGPGPGPVRALRLKQPGWRRGALRKGLGLSPRWVRGAPQREAGPGRQGERGGRPAGPARAGARSPRRGRTGGEGDGWGRARIHRCVSVCICVCLCVFVCICAEECVYTHARANAATYDLPFFPPEGILLFC